MEPGEKALASSLWFLPAHVERNAERAHDCTEESMVSRGRGQISRGRSGQLCADGAAFRVMGVE